MNKVKEIREMSDEQIRLVWKDSAESLFRLRMEAQTEKLASPSEVQKNRRTIARCQTILVQRMKAAGQVGPLLALGVVASAAGQQSHAEATSKSGKRIKNSDSRVGRRFAQQKRLVLGQCLVRFESDLKAVENKTRLKAAHRSQKIKPITITSNTDSDMNFSMRIAF